MLMYGDGGVQAGTMAAALAVSVAALYLMNSPSVKANQASSPDGAHHATPVKKTDEPTKMPTQPGGMRG